MMATSYDACRIDAKSYDAVRANAGAYDAWLTSVDTEIEEYERYWESYLEKADELLQDGKYNEEFIEFLESGDWNQRYDDLREEFLSKLAGQLEKADRQNIADFLTEMAAIDHD